MKTLLKSFVTGLLAIVLVVPAAFGQERRVLSQPELDQILAPIALYPDALLSQILMASTYPVEVVQAARWSRANPGLQGEDAVRAVERMDWDPSVKSLAAFPQILERMDAQLEWTEDLGEAFIVQEAQVMDTIQDLRHRAALAGHLDPNDHMRVVRTGDYIQIEPARPQVVYVPYYDPIVVYGPWRWAAYPPVHWAPWPGHRARTAYAPAYLWGSGITIRVGFFFGHFNWPSRHVTVVHHHPAPVVVNRHTTVIHRAPPPKAVRWEHDPKHRRGAPFRHADRRESRPAHPGSRNDMWRPDRHDDAPRLQSRSAPQSPVRALPASPRPSGAALGARERQARSPAPASVSRSSDERKPAATERRAEQVSRPAPSRENRASRPETRPTQAAVNRGDRQEQRAAPAPAARSDVRPTDAARENAPPARAAAANSRPETRPANAALNARARQASGAEQRAPAARPAAILRGDASPSAANSSAIPRAARGQQRAEMRAATTR